jgi:protein-export membrane protein SecD
MDRSLKWRTFGLVAVTVLAVLMLIPTVVPSDQVPSWFSDAGFKRKIQLGLDLQGGLHIVYGIDLDKAVDDKGSDIKRELEAKMADEKIKGSVTTPINPPGAVNVIVDDPKHLKRIEGDLLGGLFEDGVIVKRDCSPDIKAKALCVRVSSDYAEGIKESAIKQAVQTVRERIDERGVAEPNVVSKGDQIIVELPGLDQESIRRVKDIISRTAKLEFKVVDDSDDFMELVYARAYQDIKKANPGKDDDAISEERLTTPDGIGVGIDGWDHDESGKQFRDWYLTARDRQRMFTIDEAKKRGCYRRDKAVEDGKVECSVSGREVLESYLRQLSCELKVEGAPDSAADLKVSLHKEGGAAPQSPSKAAPSPTGAEPTKAEPDPEVDAQPEGGAAEPAEPEADTSEAPTAAVGGLVPVPQVGPDKKPGWTFDPASDTLTLHGQACEAVHSGGLSKVVISGPGDKALKVTTQYRLDDNHAWGYELQQQAEERAGEPLWRTYFLFRPVELAGSSVSNAYVYWNSTSNRPEVLVEFDRWGGKRFEEMTGKNVGKKMAIILDDKVSSAPVIQDRIGGGRSSITMGGGNPRQIQDEAQDLVNVLRTGSLPAPLEAQSESEVGPLLGRDAVDKAKLAFLLGAGLVVILMIWFYRFSGFLANVALTLNVLFMMAVMAGFGATLTLPGIAGLVLSVGMAVDGNIIIYERIRDELRTGKSVKGAVDAGFHRAFGAIVDGQLTTAAAGYVLYQYGSGPIKGFATMLLIGIFTSLFTCIWCTRLFFDYYVGRRRQANTISI